MAEFREKLEFILKGNAAGVIDAFGNVRLADAHREWELFTGARGRFREKLRAVGEMFGRSVQLALDESAEVMEEAAIDMHDSYEHAVAYLVARNERESAHDAELMAGMAGQLREMEHLLHRIVEETHGRHKRSRAKDRSLPPWFARAWALSRDHSDDLVSVAEPF